VVRFGDGERGQVPPPGAAVRGWYRLDAAVPGNVALSGPELVMRLAEVSHFSWMRQKARDEREVCMRNSIRARPTTIASAPRTHLLNSSASSSGDPTCRARKLRREGCQNPVSARNLRLVADQALEKVLSIIRVRQYELKAFVEEARASPKGKGRFTPELRLRLERAEQLVEERPKEKDRSSAHELLDKLDGILPLIADDDRLCLMLESELERPDAALGEAQRRRADAALAEA
jgi:hypothetical protein